MSDFRSLTLLNSTGDVTLSWNEDQDSAMREMIEEKLKEGYAFFIIEPRSSFIKLLGNKRKYIKNVSEIKSNEVVMEIDEVEYMKSLKMKNQEPLIKLKSDSKNKHSNENVINLGDKKAEKLVMTGKIAVSNVPATNYDTVKKSNSVDEIVKSHAVAFPKIVGG